MAYKTSHLTKLLVSSLNFKHSLLSQRVHSKFTRFLSSEGLKFNLKIIIWQSTFLLLAKTPETSTTAGPQLLSKLFPQTAVSDDSEVKAEQEKQRQQEEGLDLVN